MPQVTYIPADPNASGNDPNKLFKEVHQLAMSMEQKRDAEAVRTVKMFENAMQSGIPVGEKMYKQFERAMSRLGVPLPKDQADWEGAAARTITGQGSGSVAPNQAASMGGAMQADSGGAQAGQDVSRPAASQAPPGGQPKPNAIPTQALQQMVGQGRKGVAGVGSQGQPIVQNPPEVYEINQVGEGGEAAMTPMQPVGAPQQAPGQVQQVPPIISQPTQNEQGFQTPQWIQQQQAMVALQRNQAAIQAFKEQEADELTRRMMNREILTPGQIGAVLLRHGVAPTPPTIESLAMNPDQFDKALELHLGAEPEDAKRARETAAQVQLINGGQLAGFLNNTQDLSLAAKFISQGIDPRMAGIVMKEDKRNQASQLARQMELNSRGIGWKLAGQMAVVEAYGGNSDYLVPEEFKTIPQRLADYEGERAAASTLSAKADILRLGIASKQLDLALQESSGLGDGREKAAAEAFDRAINSYKAGLIDKPQLQQFFIDLAEARGMRVKEQGGLWESFTTFFGALPDLIVDRPAGNVPVGDPQPGVRTGPSGFQMGLKVQGMQPGLQGTLSNLVSGLTADGTEGE